MRLKILIFSLLFSFVGLPAVFSQSKGDEVYKKAQEFINSGEYSNAIILLKRSLALHPKSARNIQKLAYVYYLNKEYKKGEKLIKRVIESNAASVKAYQIAGDIYKGEKRLSKARRNFQQGLEKFPNSGILYNELGRVYFDKQKYTKALRAWVKGIKIAPDVAANYYYAGRLYSFSDNKFWTLIYGEIFINMERYTTRTADMKKKLLEAYTSIVKNKLSIEAASDESNDFSTLKDVSFKEAVLNTLSQSADVAFKNGVTPESMMMTRTQFLLNWDHFYKLMYPHDLFEYFQSLLNKGLFEAYNMWVFGPSGNPSGYKNWVSKHRKKMQDLTAFMKEHPLTVKGDEFYQKGKVEFHAQSNN